MTIPASYDVQILPGVISGGGSALDLSGLLLTQNTRIPIGTVSSFSTAAAVSALFGPTSQEFAEATVYFNGYQNSTALPGTLLMAQYPQTSVSAWLRGSGSFAAYTIPNIASLSGSLYVTIDGYLHSAATLNLSAATSYSSAAGLIQSALNTAEPVGATVLTGNWTIAVGTPAVFTGTIGDDVLTITAVTSGTVQIGGVIAGTGVTAGTQILAQLSSTATGGALGSTGTYAVSVPHALTPAVTITESWGLLTVSTAVATGTLSPGQTLTGTGVTALSQVTAQITGTPGGIGTYVVNLSQTTPGTGTLTASATNCTVTFDSITGGLIITSGITGTPSTIAFATGTLAASLFLTQATGAVLSQGTAAATPSSFMNALTLITQNWATFWTVTDPDGGVGNAQKLLFAQWTNASNNRYVYIAWDTDITPSLSSAATTSLGAIVTATSLSGTVPIWVPVGSNLHHAAFFAGMVAATDFTRRNGNITHKFKTQQGLVAAVTDQQTAANLKANGYNCVSAQATANQLFVYYREGSISGSFLWSNTYVNEIWLNNALQLSVLEFMTQVGSVPYNPVGGGLIEAACLDPISQALNFGAIVPGVVLSYAEVTEIALRVGFDVSATLFDRGWYMQVQTATSQVRQARKSPPILFFYTDGGSVHNIVIPSIDVQ